MKAATSAILSQISGKLGPLTGKHTRRGQEISRKSTPYKISQAERSMFQLEAQQKYSALITKWQALSEEEKAAFNVQGNTLKLSGWNVFLKENFGVLAAQYGTAEYGTGTYS